MCGSTEYETAEPKGWDALYFCCSRCGHQREMQSGSGSQDELYYEDESYLYFSPFSQWLSATEARRRINVLKRHLPSGHVLEIGPGAGAMIVAAQREGFSVSGAENSKVFVKRLRSKTDATIYEGFFEDIDFGMVKFDGILSFHVLEHIPEPTRHLQRMLDVTKPGGYLLLATPNVDSWDRRLCRARWTGYSIGHLNLFSLRSIRGCLERAGWKIINVSTVEMPWQLLWSIKVGIKPKKTTPESAGSNVKRIPLRAGAATLTLFGALTAPLRFVQERLDGGTEMFVVAQKSR